MGSIHHTNVNPSLGLPDNLASLCISQFDNLVSQGEIIYEPSVGHTQHHYGFGFEFRVAPHIKKKPMTASNAPERKTGKGFNPFLNPDPNFVISPVGDTHTLLHNKFCVRRPSLLLITRDFARQSDVLDASDLTAVWASLGRLGGKDYFAIYNCGYEAGSSLGHKHMQIFPRPSKGDLGFELFPSEAQSTTSITSDIQNVPFKHFALRLPKDASAGDVAASHERLLEKMREAQELAGTGPAHNVVLTRDWICLIPRSKNGLERQAPANACGMIGMVWVATEEEMDIWEDIGPVNQLQYLGIPR